MDFDVWFYFVLQHCNDEGQWNRMGIMFQNLLQNHNAHSEHHRIATCIAIALIKNKDKGTQAPFCEFAKAGGVHLITISLKVLMLLTTGLQIVLQIFGSQNTHHYQWWKGGRFYSSFYYLATFYFRFNWTKLCMCVDNLLSCFSSLFIFKCG